MKRTERNIRKKEVRERRVRKKRENFLKKEV